MTMEKLRGFLWSEKLGGTGNKCPQAYHIPLWQSHWLAPIDHSQK